MTILPAEYCPDCGRKLTTRWHEDTQQPYCKACDRMFWQQPIPCVDLAVVDGTRVLLIKRDNPPHAGAWALPGGFIDIDETPEEAAVRELTEEAGIDASPADLILFDTYAVAVEEKGWYNIGLNFAVPREQTTGTPVAGTDAQEARFWTLEDVLDSKAGLRPEPDDESRIRTAIETLKHN